MEPTDFAARRTLYPMKLRMSLLVLLAAAPVAADEGLWLFNQFPKDQIKQKYNVDITDQFVDNLRLASLRIGGASGAFVSPKGLILTSRRAVSDCAAKASETLKEKLRQVTDAYEAGLLTEEEYREKKEQVLKEL